MTGASIPGAAAAGATVAIITDVAGGASPVGWVSDATIAGVIVGVSLFWLRRADRVAKNEREEWVASLRWREAQIAALLRGYGVVGQPLPREYVELLEHSSRDQFRVRLK